MIDDAGGFPQLRRIVDGVLSVRADGIKSAVALSALDQLAATSPPPARDPIYDALDAAGRWRSFATFGSTPAQSRVAHAIHRAYYLLWQQLRALTPNGAT